MFLWSNNVWYYVNSFGHDLLNTKTIMLLRLSFLSVYLFNYFKAVFSMSSIYWFLDVLGCSISNL